MRYAVVIEKGERNHSAYVPDLTGASRSATLWKRRGPKSARRLNFTSKACGRLRCRSRSRNRPREENRPRRHGRPRT
jgi:hypothetical protein